MPIAVTVAEGGVNLSNLTVYDTGSVALQAGELCLVFVSIVNAGAPRTATLTATGLTFTKVNEATYEVGTDTISAHYAIVGPDGFTGVITITGSGSANQGHWAVLRVTGHNPINPVPQSATNTAASGGTFSVSLGDPVEPATSRSFIAAAHHTFEGSGVGTGITELTDDPGNSPATGWNTGWSDTAWVASPSLTGTSSEWGAIAVEVAADIRGRSSLVVPSLRRRRR